jgi:hypothetical protein
LFRTSVDIYRFLSVYKMTGLHREKAIDALLLAKVRSIR